MFQKGHAKPMFRAKTTPILELETDDMDDTEFEEDLSDIEEYSGRRSEESVSVENPLLVRDNADLLSKFGKHSDTSLSTFDELQTPKSGEFVQLHYQVPDKVEPPKPVEGPVGPHLFRMSQESTQDVEFYLSMSPPYSHPGHWAKSALSPEECHQPEAERLPLSSVPLRQWSPKQVIEWMTGCDFERSLIEKFRMHDISGAILEDLQFGDLKELGVHSFGQRHGLWNEIRKLRGSDVIISPAPTTGREPSPRMDRSPCSSPATPEEDPTRSSATEKRRARRARRPDDVISPAESASIVAIEQLLPKPHHCSKGENCSKWQKQQRKLAKIAKEFPLELQQIGEANASPTSTSFRPASEVVPSVVASSDLLGPGPLPALRLDENVLKVVKTRDPQENVRQFLNFQHVAKSPEEPSTPPYEMFPPLSPPSNTQAPHGHLRRLPKLTIPETEVQAPLGDTFSPDRTIVRPTRTPLTAMEIKDQNNPYDIFRLGSPASAMDVPVTAIPLGPIAREESNSVPPDMRYGADPVSRSSSRLGHRQPISPISRPYTCAPPTRSTSRASHRRQPSFVMPPVEERVLTPIDGEDEMTPIVQEVHHAGWMKKRKTKMLRHEWHENYFRLNGTRLATHRDSKASDILEAIDVDEYAVACSSLASNKLGAAFKSLKINGKKKDGDPAAFSFQLVPAAEKKGILNAATGKTHHFAVKTRDERIDWMRELMLAKALRQKGDGCEVNLNGNAM